MNLHQCIVYRYIYIYTLLLLAQTTHHVILGVGLCARFCKTLFWGSFLRVSLYASIYSRFLAILAHVTWPWAQLQDRSILLEFLLETRLESKVFEPLISFLAFLVQKPWPKNN